MQATDAYEIAANERPRLRAIRILKGITVATITIGALILYVAAFHKVKDSLNAPSNFAFWLALAHASVEVFLASVLSMSRLTRWRVAGFVCLWGAFAAYHGVALLNGSLVCPCFGSLKVAHKLLLFVSLGLSSTAAIAGFLMRRDLPKWQPRAAMEFVRPLGLTLGSSVALVLVAAAGLNAYSNQFAATPLRLSFSRAENPGGLPESTVPVSLEVRNTGSGEIVLWGLKTSSCTVALNEPLPKAVPPHGVYKLKMLSAKKAALQGELVNVRLFFSVDKAGLDVTDVRLPIAAATN